MQGGKEAYLYERRDDGKVHCYLCNHHCVIASGKRGICGVRENNNGTLYTLVYERLITANVDPIEKKPLFHLQPGTRAFSVATVGCNFRCLHCQNHEISQISLRGGEISGDRVPPRELVAMALRYDCASIAYTYTEPTIFFEYAFDTAKLSSERKLRNCFVTNGYMTMEAIDMIAPFLDAANVDLKSYSDTFYKDICGANVAPVLEAIRGLKDRGVWVEVTTLIIPTLNDSDDELRNIARFISSIGREIPWHVSAFYPSFKMLDKPRTPPETIHRARQIGLDEGLRYVYTGNIMCGEGEDTYCHQCHSLLIGRRGYHISENRVRHGACPVCGATIDGIWD
jgi:pyruvate formate lyase activating enzyme